jgi:hypothetical protein
MRQLGPRQRDLDAAAGVCSAAIRMGDPMTLRSTMIGGALAAMVLSALPTIAQSPSADTMRAARELVVGSRAGDQIKTLLPLIVQQIKPMIVQNRPEVERDLDQIMPLMLELINSRIEQFTDTMAQIYARNFTVDELRQIQAFYQSPTGQKLLDRTPAIAHESMALAQSIGQGIGNELRDRAVNELRKRGHKI